jgi:DNA-binding IclR family transcriptional regulator
VAAISIVAPEHRLNKANREALTKKACAAAAELSKRLGAR